MAPFPIVPSRPNELTVWSDPTGKPYLIQQKPGGEVRFTPLETALTQLQSPAEPTRQQDPIALLGMAVCLTLGLVATGFFVGFVAGHQGREPVIVPRSPICQTQESSFLFWNSRREDCK